MKIKSVTVQNSAIPILITDCYVGDGYLQGTGGVLADVDIDFQSDRRQEVKEYLEHRYNTNGKQRVFSAGTLTTLKIKAAIKDVARVHKVPLNITNYITAIFDDDKMNWTDLFRLAATNKKVKDFITRYPLVIEDIRGLMGQPRSASVHASAILITPETKDGNEMECFDYTPIKRVDDMLVSEFDGYSLDEVGLLKNDCLGIKELSKIQQTISECNRIYGAKLSFDEIVKGGLDDDKTYQILSDGYSQNVFQFSSKGMTRFLLDMRPDNINDLIAANALYRPATLESGSAEKYLDIKRGDVAPEYLWGTYNALKDSNGQLTYQESLAQIVREVGGFSLGEGVKLLKLISKKRIDKIHAMKEKFMAGAAERGCPQEDAVQIWDMVESGGSYLFNKCISGKETIYRPHGGRWKPTIGEMYKILNDIEYAKQTKHVGLRKKYMFKGYGMGFSLNEEKRLIKNQIKDIRFVGVKSLYRITLEGGNTIDVTANHKHPTQRGEVRTDCLKIGQDAMFVNIGNLTTLCVSCHKIVHYKMGRRKMGEHGLYTELRKVIAVEYIGEDEVYDVEMEAPNHSFVTSNGVVTCNSHATAYAITAYIGAYLKANYPTAFYTVALQWADDKEITALMSEMEQCSEAKIVPPDINVSDVQFFTDYTQNKIFWSLTRIKMIGTKTTAYIIEERNKNGTFTSIENFIHRIFCYKLKKYEYWDDPEDANESMRVPVNARHIRNMILAGCFDNVEQISSIEERYDIVQRAATELGFELREKDFPTELIGKPYYWSMQQIAVSGIGSIDYRAIFDATDAKVLVKGKAKYMRVVDALDMDNEGKRIAVCATVSEVEEKSYKDKMTGEKKRFAKVLLRQNNDMIELVLWDDFLSEYGKDIAKLKDKVIVVSAVIKYSDYSGTNSLNSYKSTILQLI